MKPRRDLTKIVGLKYQRLTILEAWYIERGHIKVKAICECGVIKTYDLQPLESKKVHSCGCKKIENLKHRPPHLIHGLTNHPIFILHRNMISRCYNEDDINFINYGAIGVTVCRKWRENKMAFYNWAIENGWSKGMQLDKDKLSPHKTGKIYSPKYCCFLTRKENMQHRSNGIFLTHNGRTQTISIWASELNVSLATLHTRLDRGWSDSEIIETPIRDVTQRKKLLNKSKVNSAEISIDTLIEYNGQSRRLPSWCKKFNLPYAAIYGRIKYAGWSYDKALSTPIKTAKLIFYNNQYKTLKQWAELIGIEYITLHRRISHGGWSYDKSFTTPVSHKKAS